MPMMPNEIGQGRCYRMTSNNGRKVDVRVEHLGEQQLRFTEEVGRPGAETFTLTTRVVRFVWRAAVQGAQWSGSQQQMPLANFALHAETEVPCD
jgi:hypothetical protein